LDSSALTEPADVEFRLNVLKGVQLRTFVPSVSVNRTAAQIFALNASTLRPSHELELIRDALMKAGQLRKRGAPHFDEKCGDLVRMNWQLILSNSTVLDDSIPETKGTP
jgi:hypothetical protein